MTTEVYSGLIAKVLEYGDFWKAPFRRTDNYDYLADGFNESHIPDLIRIVEDDEMANGETDQAWAQPHAWRILGQLRAEDAIVPLIGQLHYIDDRFDDAIQEEVPEVLAQIGPAALDPVADYLADQNNGDWARVAAIATLEEMSKTHPTTRARCIEILAQQLEHFAEQSEVVNASLIDRLTELGAVEAAPIIERAFASGRVDLALRGDWEDIQVELGLLDERSTPKRNYVAEAIFGRGRLSDSRLDGGDEDEEEDEPGRPGLLTTGLEPPAIIDPKKKKRKRKDAQKQRKAQRRKKKK